MGTITFITSKKPYSAIFLESYEYGCVIYHIMHQMKNFYCFIVHVLSVNDAVLVALQILLNTLKVVQSVNVHS